MITKANMGNESKTAKRTFLIVLEKDEVRFIGQSTYDKAIDEAVRLAQAYTQFRVRVYLVGKDLPVWDSDEWRGITC